MCLVVQLNYRLVAAKAVDPIQPRPGDARAERVRWPPWYQSKASESHAEILIGDSRARVVDPELKEARDSVVVHARVFPP